MEVFTSGSWKDININTSSASAQVAERPATPVATAFTPSLHRQLQQIGEVEGQRLAVIEQALHDKDQPQA